MKKFINNIVIAIAILIIGFVIICCLSPKFVLNTIVLIAGFAIPTFIIIVTMIAQINISKKIEEKEKIFKFWLKTLFVIYVLFLITILFFNNEYRRAGFYQNIKMLSKEHFETINVIPFATIIGYINRLLNNGINTSIVIINIVTNLVLFAPMGFFIQLLFGDRIKNIKQFSVFMIVITLIVEILQFITYRGETDIDDIILNTTGAIIVYCLMQTKFVKGILNKVICK